MAYLVKDAESVDVLRPAALTLDKHSAIPDRADTYGVTARHENKICVGIVRSSASHKASVNGLQAGYAGSEDRLIVSACQRVNVHTSFREMHIVQSLATTVKRAQ